MRASVFRTFASAMLVLALVATSCGGDQPSNVTSDEMVLRGLEVSGETVIYDNLFDQDTVLWFWAPW